MPLNKDQALNVAKVLTEALPYIQTLCRQNTGREIRW